MSSNETRRVMVAVGWLEMAAQGSDAQAEDCKKALQRVIEGFSDRGNKFTDEERERAMAALDAAYDWRHERVAKFIVGMEEAFSMNLEDAKDLIRKR